MTTLDRIYAKIKIDPVSACWMWQGACKPGIVPSISGGHDVSPHHRTIYVVIIAYRLLRGPLPDKARLLQPCEGGIRCVNPYHRTVKICPGMHTRRYAPPTTSSESRRQTEIDSIRSRPEPKYTPVTPELHARIRKSEGSSVEIGRKTGVAYTTVARIRRSKITVW